MNIKQKIAQNNAYFDSLIHSDKHSLRRAPDKLYEPVQQQKENKT